MLPLFLILGIGFGLLAAGCAYVISYSEHRRRFLNPGQSARRMALETAVVTFIFFFVAALVLWFVLTVVLRPPGQS
ncbi:MAG: hypothetical protein ACM3NQ_15365 [Bacteroidales bacterium]